MSVFKHYFAEHVKSMFVALYPGVDATVIFQGWQVLRPHNNIVGGASQNYFLYIGEKSKKEMVNVLK